MQLRKQQKILLALVVIVLIAYVLYGRKGVKAPSSQPPPVAPVVHEESTSIGVDRVENRDNRDVPVESAHEEKTPPRAKKSERSARPEVAKPDSEVAEVSIPTAPAINGAPVEKAPLETTPEPIAAAEVARQAPVEALPEAEQALVEVPVVTHAAPAQHPVQNDTKELADLTVAEAPKAAEPPHSLKSSKTRAVPLRFSDVYSLEGKHDVRLKSATSAVRVDVPLKWAADSSSSEYQVEISESILEKNVVSVSKNSYTLRKVTPGKHYWRVANQNGVWSKSAIFEVKTRLAAKPVEFTTDSLTANLEDVSTTVEWSNGDPSGGYVLEISDSKDFSSGDVKRVFLKEATYDAHFDRTGTFYARVQRANRQMQLSEFSAPMTIVVDSPQPVETLSAAEQASGPERSPASEETGLLTEVHPSRYQLRNDRYRDSSVAFESSGIFERSSEQYSRGEEGPALASVGVRGRYWIDDNGFEAAGKTRVMGLNSAGNAQSPTSLDLRAMHRWLYQLDLPYVREMQMTAFGGLEIFRDSASARFSPGYNLMKAGLMFDFPVASRLTTGGEFVGGYGFDSSIKLEIAGNFKYFLERSWEIGAGYRAHLFQAGSDASAPAGLPYREAYAEILLLFQYSFGGEGY